MDGPHHGRDAFAPLVDPGLALFADPPFFEVPSWWGALGGFCSPLMGFIN